MAIYVRLYCVELNVELFLQFYDMMKYIYIFRVIDIYFGYKATMNKSCGL